MQNLCPNSPSKLGGLNPLGKKVEKNGSKNGNTSNLLGGASLIDTAQWKALLARQQSCDNNDDRITQLEKEKIPYLFTSVQMMELIEITPSVKTRLAMIAHLGPRLVDPKAKANQFIQLFRYVEEKERVEGILKMRTNVLAASLFKTSSLNEQSNPPTKTVPLTTTTAAAVPFCIKGLAGARSKQQATTSSTSPMKDNKSEVLDSKSLHEISPTQQRHSFYKNISGSPSSPSLEQVQVAQVTSRNIHKLFLEVDTVNKVIKSSSSTGNHSSVVRHSSTTSSSSSELSTVSRLNYLRKGSGSGPAPEVITTSTSSTSRWGSTNGSHSKYNPKAVVMSSPSRSDIHSVNTTMEGDLYDNDEQNNHTKRPSVRELRTNFDRTTKQHANSTTTDTASTCSSPAVSPTKSWDLWGTVMKTASFFQSTSGRSIGINNHLTSTVAGQIGADLGFYRDLPVEGPVGMDADGIQQFRYQELLRKNVVKDYDGIVYPAELERHCMDDDFVLMFGMNKEAFSLLPAWKKIQQKKSLLLF